MKILLPPWKRGLQWCKAYILPGPGGNGSTDIRDETGKTLSPRNGPTISTSVSKIYKSISLNGSTQDLYYAPDSSFNFLTGELCFQAYARQDASADKWLFYLNTGSPLHIGIEVVNNDRAYAVCGGSIIDARGLTIAPGTWYHWCLERKGTTIRLYKDGVVIGSDTNSGNVGSSSQSLYVGSYGGSMPWNGNIELFRVDSKALYGGTFTPPVRRF